MCTWGPGSETSRSVPDGSGFFVLTRHKPVQRPLVVRWSGLCAPNTQGTASVPGRGGPRRPGGAAKKTQTVLKTSLLWSSSSAEAVLWVPVLSLAQIKLSSILIRLVTTSVNRGEKPRKLGDLALPSPATFPPPHAWTGRGPTGVLLLGVQACTQLGSVN